jgi:hypothetical protein
MLNDTCAAIKVTIPNFNPHSKKITIKETAVMTSALINGMFATPNHLRDFFTGSFHKPMTAIRPTTREIIVEVTATNNEVTIDFRNGELWIKLSYHLKLHPLKTEVDDPLLKEKIIIVKIGM